MPAAHVVKSSWALFAFSENGEIGVISDKARRRRACRAQIIDGWPVRQLLSEQSAEALCRLSTKKFDTGFSSKTVDRAAQHLGVSPTSRRKPDKLTAESHYLTAPIVSFTRAGHFFALRFVCEIRKRQKRRDQRVN